MDLVGSGNSDVIVIVSISGVAEKLVLFLFNFYNLGLALDVFQK